MTWMTWNMSRHMEHEQSLTQATYDSQPASQALWAAKQIASWSVPYSQPASESTSQTACVQLSDKLQCLPEPADLLQCCSDHLQSLCRGDPAKALQVLHLDCKQMQSLCISDAGALQSCQICVLLQDGSHL